MLQEFSKYYLDKAEYELIDDGKVFYGRISQLKGVWATGKTLEECRKNLIDVMDGWLILRIKKNLVIPNFKIPFKKISSVGVYA